MGELFVRQACDARELAIVVQQNASLGTPVRDCFSRSTEKMLPRRRCSKLEREESRVWVSESERKRGARRHDVREAVGWCLMDGRVACACFVAS